VRARVRACVRAWVRACVRRFAVAVPQVAARTATREPAARGAFTSAPRGRCVQREDVMLDFVSEVEVCCGLCHPNLVQLLGYATSPRLLIVQELMCGQSLQHQLYVERWRPEPADIRKIAMDVALGLEYMHTAFIDDPRSSGQPVIHRDIKSPNVLLSTAPGKVCEPAPARA
jgi:serine/threonine protein kinase